ncbi:hypothetical protein GCM10023100_19110 [Actinocorallia cavernae]|uniref:Uncharacterized protein n=2 Tax=Actinomycetes TaxID=1760 RepID=A0ABP8SHE0_9ACTN|nr:hypothetical protein SRO_1841 [Streptomyces rochei]
MCAVPSRPETGGEPLVVDMGAPDIGEWGGDVGGDVKANSRPRNVLSGRLL